MSSLRLRADVHISPLTVAALRLQGYDIVRTTDFLPATAADAEILELARVEGQVILTQDLDFSLLVALNNYGLPSLITLRLSSARPDVVAQRLLVGLRRFRSAKKAQTITGQRVNLDL
ncbi:hypothetical protein myaer102_22850 [Microcystis viridis NIES-102]|uniref:DUF5615 domain-containing protein n=1 Tax=Microcystis viridis NIES-102 TaxID=213615 RepID=A0A3G9JID9_MICVR|nr:DUF5615 family PIN-like protein [Microcystis viridis]BBH39742.1 hypothetical protein myaer102_22850 [Microcystis viridis NIES-102]